MGLSIVILAAGQGKRMHSALPKVLHRLAGKTLLGRVAETSLALHPTHPPIIIYGHQGDALLKALPNLHATWIEQKEQLGTGHAVLQALPSIPENHRVLILSGDVPLVSIDTLNRLITETPPEGLGIITTHVENPKGLGRILRSANRDIVQIVEEKDASSEQRNIHEINAGIYLASATHLKKWLPRLTQNNAQKEYYVTDILSRALTEKIMITSIEPSYAEEVYGVNDHAQLAFLERFYQRQLAEKLMREGLTLLDPHRFDVRGALHVGRDVSIDVNVIIEGNVTIGNNTSIGPNCILRDCLIGNNVTIKANTIIEQSEIAEDCVIGPFARIRPDTTLSSHVHIGNFVEIKKSAIGQGTKINHLSYVGDATVGDTVNIGAGMITCNYDGFTKHRTTIGHRVQVGSDTTLVAPITIGDDAYIATATTVRHDVPSGSLVFNKRTEDIRENWTASKRAAMKKSLEKK